MPEEVEVREEAKEPTPTQISVLMAKEIADEVCDGSTWANCRKFIMRILLLGDISKNHISEIPPDERERLKKKLEELGFA